MQRLSSISSKGPGSSPPPVAPRKDRPVPLRRLHSSGSNHYDPTGTASSQEYTSEYDKLKSYLQQSIVKTKELRTLSEPYMDNTGRPRAHTHAPLPTIDDDDDDEDIYLSARDIASVPMQRTNMAHQKRSTSPLPPAAAANMQNFIAEPPSHGQVRHVVHPQKKPDFYPETAIYGVAQGKGTNLVMALKEAQKPINNLYSQLLNMDCMAPEMADLKTHLRIADNASIKEVLQYVHQSMQPPELEADRNKQDSEIYLIDFSNCTEKAILREQILHLFTTPGPPSVAYQRVNAKLDALIHIFADTVVKMRIMKNETIASPFHVQSILQGQDADQLLRVLQSNELWIRWGTETGLPPLHHIYMLKQPPSYEMRKAITLSMIAAKKNVIKMLFTNHSRAEILIPPIYSKMECDTDKWQVTEFNSETRKFESHECAFPLWIEECTKLVSHLKSSNRSTFSRGDHIYALYSVYIIVIKDITLTENSFLKESKMPCSHQIFVGSSSTGVLYRFLNIKNNHCERIQNILKQAPTLKSFRCFQDCTLAEACLTLSWIRRQPRAVFVINSFQEGDMTNLSLNKKKPFHDKMISLQQHYINSKKLGPLNDMRYGMNSLGYDQTNAP